MLQTYSSTQYNIANFPKPGGKSPLNFLSYAFVTCPFLIYLGPNVAPLTF